MMWKHFFYPSSVVGCGRDIDKLYANELTCLRKEVTCPDCLVRIREDRLICSFCRNGTGQHTCDVLYACDPARMR